MKDLLPEISPLSAAASRILTGEGRYLPVEIAGKKLEFAFVPGVDVQGTPATLLPMECEGEGFHFGIQIRPDGLLSSRFPGGIPAEPDDLRKVMLASLGREILDALSRSMNASLRMADASPAMDGEALRFSYRVTSGEEAPEAWGFLEAASGVVNRLLSAASGWARRPGPLAESLDAALPVILSTVTVPSHDLASLRSGDLLIVSPVDQIDAQVRLGSGRTIKCSLPPVNGETDSALSAQTTERSTAS